MHWRPDGVGLAQAGRAMSFAMVFDPSTLFVAVVVSTFANSVLLFWSWWQNRDAASLLCMAVGLGAAGVGSVLLAARDSVPAFLAVDIANALIIFGVGAIWLGVRIFNGRPTPHWAALGGVAIWLLLVQIPAIADSFAWRVSVAALLAASYGLLAARELWSRDGLKSRVPIAFLLVIHAIVVLLRIPAAFSEAALSPADFGGKWFAPMALEALVFVQALALLMVSLTKERAEARLRTIALTDALTGLANRRAFFADGRRLIANGQASGQPTSLIAFDLDGFKLINDTYGHPFGDAVLEAFAVATRTGLRVGDLAGRIGGEEFAAILPGADETEARAAAGRVIAIFADIAGASESDRRRFPASAGLAVSPASAESIDALMAAADRALYAAKRGGGDQMRIAAPAFA